MTNSIRARVLSVYERHERFWDLSFFTAGFLFDIVATREGVDHPILVVQQIVYLAVSGGTLYLELLDGGASPVLSNWPRFARLWQYRSLWLHFCLGTLMNLYSIFFLISASIFSSAVFVVVLFGAVAANESRALRKRGVHIPIALYVLCVFCFFSLMIPIALGRVGVLPFAASLVATLLVLAGFVYGLGRRLEPAVVRRRLLVPGLSMSACFLVLYLVGFIPPVPIAAKKIGIYHRVAREGDAFVLSRDTPRWRFWSSDDQDFAAEPGDSVYMFVAIFSPTRFSDRVVVRWQRHDAAAGWQDSDRIPIKITGGRKEGFRGFTSKERYAPGEWRVVVETSDGREIGRRRFTITPADADPQRVFTTDRY